MPLPSDLLLAISREGAGQVVLVVGAGCSVEPPTSLPLADQCAVEAHRRLVADGILVDGDCADPKDLSCVADTVMSKTNSQRELVLRLPREPFRHAEPNQGYLIAAAMLRERAISYLMTLNFDLAMSTALSQVGATKDVTIVAGPEDHSSLGAVSLIYLHRNVNADLEKWILRSSALAEEWQGQWEEVMAHRVLASPVTVFAGLGAPAAVLVETVKRIGKALPDAVQAYQVDPAPRESSAFFLALDIPEDAYLQMGWVAFMEELSTRLLGEHCNELQEACRTQADREGWEAENVTDLCHRLVQGGLVGLGRIRARWMLNDQAYSTRASVQPEWLADLILAAELIERTIRGKAFFGDDGVVDFRRENKALGSVIFAHGRGIHSWLVLENKIRRSVRYHIRRTPIPSVVLVSGVQGMRPSTISLPQDIVTGANDPQNLITGPDGFELLSVDELRQQPDLAKTIIN